MKIELQCERCRRSFLAVRSHVSSYERWSGYVSFDAPHEWSENGSRFCSPCQADNEREWKLTEIKRHAIESAAHREKPLAILLDEVLQWDAIVGSLRTMIEVARDKAAAQQQDHDARRQSQEDGQ